MLNTGAVPKLKLLAVVGLSALGLAACGGDSEEAQGPDEVTKAFLTAIAEEDGEAACGYASAAALEQIEAEEGGTCEESVSGAAAGATDEDRQQVEDATYEVADESEDSATVTVVRPDGGEETFQLVKEDDEWKVEG